MRLLAVRLGESYPPSMLDELLGHPHLEQWRQIGRKYTQHFHLFHGEEVKFPYKKPPYGTCRVQVVRSVSDWSHGVLTEHSIQNACTLFDML